MMSSKGTLKMKKRSFSYEELMSRWGRPEIEELAKAGMLTDATLARVVHLLRFFERTANACPNPDLKVGDVLTEAEVQKFWEETAHDGADVGSCPLVH